MEIVVDCLNKDLHVHNPLGSSVISMRGGQWSNIMGLSIVVPGDQLNEPGAESQDVFPSVIP